MKRYRRTLLLIGIWLLCTEASMAACSETDRQAANDLFKQARVAQGDVRVALIRQSYQRCAHRQTAFYLGKLAADARNGETAESYLKQADDLATADEVTFRAKIKSYLALAYLQQDQLSNAVSSSEEALALLGQPEAAKRPPWLQTMLIKIDTAREVISANDIAGVFRSLKSVGVAPAIHLRVQFDLNSARITEQGVAQTRALGQAMEKLSAMGFDRFTLIGHTDTQGYKGRTRTESGQLNKILGGQRADEVRRQLEREIPGLQGRINVESKGWDSPRHQGDSKEVHALNRRVEVRVSKARAGT